MNWWDFENFYEPKTHKNIEKGDVIITPVLYLDPQRNVLKVERDNVDASTHNSGNFFTEKLDYTKHFKQQSKTLPVYNLRLRINEEILLNKAKMRPCVVLHMENENIQKPTDNDNAVPNLNKQSVFLLPLYGFTRDSTGIQKFSDIMRKRIMCLQYNKLFFFPKDNDKSSNITKDSFGRFDMCFNVPKSYVCATSRKVSNTYMKLLDLYKAVYFDMPTNDDFFNESKALLSLAQGQYN